MVTLATWSANQLSSSQQVPQPAALFLIASAIVRVFFEFCVVILFLSYHINLTGPPAQPAHPILFTYLLSKQIIRLAAPTHLPYQHDNPYSQITDSQLQVAWPAHKPFTYNYTKPDNQVPKAQAAVLDNPGKGDPTIHQSSKRLPWAENRRRI